MKPIEVSPVKLIAGILYSDEALLKVCYSKLENSFGYIDYKSEPFTFNITDYYIPEMGSPIYRLFISFQKLVNPNQLANIKLKTNEIENELAVNRKRKINIDSGYMDFDKVVLASAKYNGDKIYLDQGIWADLTIRYSKSVFTPYPWSFPDFKTGIYNETLIRIREKFKIQCKK